MLIRVGIENNNDNRSIAWALEHPGCFAYGADAVEAEAAMPDAVQQYAAWVHDHGMKWMDERPFRIGVQESFNAYRLYGNTTLPVASNPLVESFFHHDAEPLTGMEVERGMKLLDWGRRDLLESIQGLSDEQLNEQRPGERWSINGILLHVAHAEWWYAACVSPALPPRESDLPAEPLGSLELVRAHFMALLSKQEAVQHMAEVEGERWSFRKMLRRAVWHERDHTQHIWNVRTSAGW